MTMNELINSNVIKMTSIEIAELQVSVMTM